VARTRKAIRHAAKMMPARIARDSSVLMVELPPLGNPADLHPAKVFPLT
jgi:hypothetical protein